MKEFDEAIGSHAFLVTGGAGFIGSNIVEYLLTHNARKVVVLDNFSTGFRKNIETFLSNPAFQLIEGDIRDLDTCKRACKNVDFVTHQAALGSVPRSINDPITSNDVNVSGFLNMLVAARDQNIRRFIYAASSSTYGDSKLLPKVEDVIGKPLSPYAVTKYVNELYADVFAKTYHLDSIGLRYFNVFGPKQNPNGAYAAVIPLFIQAVLEHRAPFINGDGLQTRDFTYVDNAVQANVRAMLSSNQEVVNQVYNIAVGDRSSVLNLFERLNKIGNKHIVPQFRVAREGDVHDSLADISKAKALLGYDPQVSFASGLEKTYRWFQSNRGYFD